MPRKSTTIGLNLLDYDEEHLVQNFEMIDAMMTDIWEEINALKAGGTSGGTSTALFTNMLTGAAASDGTMTISFSGWQGYDFKVSQTSSLTAIEYYVGSNATKVGIWDVATSTKLGEVATNGTLNSWQRTNLANAVPLTANKTYFIGEYTTNSSSISSYNGVGNGYTEGIGTVLGNRTALSSGDTFPTNNGGANYPKVRPVVS